MQRIFQVIFGVLFLGLLALVQPVSGQTFVTPIVELPVEDRPNFNAVTGSEVSCENGQASGFPCSNVHLLAYMPIQSIGGSASTDLNDIWGWTDPVTGSEYALVGREDGAAFVDISDPENPVYVGDLLTQSSSSLWRDLKVYNDHVFIVSEASNHGMQVFDLSNLRNVSNPPQRFSASAHYNGIGSAHNIVINEASGYAFIVGSGGSGQSCSGGLHMVDLQNPLSPTFAGCFSSDGYTHDAQCVIYNGPDAQHVGKEICVASNEDTITIVDVTNKNNPVQISRVGYPQDGYVHQGWLTEDHRYFLEDDELDELSFGFRTRSIVWDLEDLDDPTIVTEYQSSSPAIDHNQYIKGNHTYQANYTAGLRILDLTDVSNPVEVGYFDTVPANDAVTFLGAWSNYPFFESGVVVVSSIAEGLFILRPDLPEVGESNLTINLTPSNDPIVLPPEGGAFTFEISITNDGGVAAQEQVWLTITKPDNGTLLFGPVNPNVPAGATITKTMNQNIPSLAPSGTYTYGAKIGTFPNNVISENSFDFEKNAGVGVVSGAEPTSWSPLDISTGEPLNSNAAWSVVLSDEEEDLPTTFALDQNYPNPFNPTTSIAYQLDVAGTVQLRVYDMLGKEVAVLATGQQAPGTYTVTWDATDKSGAAVPAGVYLYQLTVDGRTTARSMVLLK